MSKTKLQKQDIVQSYADKLEKAKSVVFVDYSGVKVKENQQLRKDCKKENAEYLAAKKSLLKRALEKKGVTEINPDTMQGSLGVVFGYEDEVAPAKLVYTFIKKNKIMSILAGIVDSKILSAQEINVLAKLPSKQELLAKMVGSLNAPISGFVNVLAGNLRGLVQVLNAIKEKKV